MRAWLAFGDFIVYWRAGCVITRSIHIIVCKSAGDDKNKRR